MTGPFKKTVLSNGIRIVSEKMDGVRSVSIGVWIHAGSRQETRKRNGVSHFLEHMLFKGTRSRTTFEIATSLESLGGHLNAFTEREFTCCFAVVLDENLPEAIDVLADVVQHPLLNLRDIENEKRIVFEEIKNVEDTPEEYLQEYFLQAVFPNHSLGFSTLGTFDSVGGIRRSDLAAYRKAYYINENIIVSAAGNLEHGVLVRLIERALRDLPSGKRKANPPARFGESISKTIHRPTTQTHILTAMPAYGYMDLKKFSLIVLDAYLGGGMSSRLFQNIRENQGLAYSVYSFIDFWADAGLWGVYTGTSPKLARKASESIEHEFEELLSRGMSEHDLNRLKNQITGNLLLTLEDPSSRMNRLAKMEAYANQYTSVDGVLSKIRNVSLDDVRQAAVEILGKNKRFTVVMEPESK